MRWFGSLALVAGITGCAVEAPEVALEGPDAPGNATFAPDELTELYLVEFNEPSRAAGGVAELRAVERHELLLSAADKGLRYRQRYSFEGLWNGISVEVGADDVAELAMLPNVKAIFPVVTFEQDGDPVEAGTPGGEPVNDPELSSAITMSGASIVQSQMGFTGEGVFVAVIDSGIDYDHPDLGNGCFGPGCRVAYGHDFVGDQFDARVSSTKPVEDADPDDCGGHGTHVAGIIGASGAVTGVAPDVTLGAYRVFGCAGSTNSDIMLAAMERARDDGARVVNMSIGSPFAWPEYPTATAADALVDEGVVVVTSGGNSGTSGLFATGAPGVGEKVIATAAVNNLQSSNLTFRTGAQVSYGYSRATAAPASPTAGNAPLARTGTPATTNDACSALPAGSLTGQIALIRRGTCSFYIKSSNAQAAGAAGVVLYNNTTGPLSPTVAAPTGQPPITIPVVAISQADGNAINAEMDAGATSLTWTDQVMTFPLSGANLISSFSSYGPTCELSFKPDISAPGGAIFSTYPLELGAYAAQDGTSMASPHVAGTVALLLQAQPGLQASMVRDVLQNNAVPLAFNGNPNLGVPDQTFRQGAGMVRIDRAIMSSTVITPGKLALGETPASGPHTATLTVWNMGAADVTYTVSHVGAASATGDHFTPTAVTADFADVMAMPAMVTVPSGGSATVDLHIAPNAAVADGALFGGYIVFTPSSGDGILRVPYAGFKGDYQSIPTIVPTANNYPWVARYGGTNAQGQIIWNNQPSGSTFSMSGGDIPYVVAFINHSPRKVIMDVEQSPTGKPWGRAREVDYEFQNNAANATNFYSWNGDTVLNNKVVKVPNGTYVIKLKLLRALGDESNPAHWDTWTSPVVTINR